MTELEALDKLSAAGVTYLDNLQPNILQVMDGIRKTWQEEAQARLKEHNADLRGKLAAFEDWKKALESSGDEAKEGWAHAAAKHKELHELRRQHHRLRAAVDPNAIIPKEYL